MKGLPLTVHEPLKSSVYVSLLNIFIFFRLPEKFWTNLSEITAPLPLNLLNLIFLKNKVKGQLGGKEGAVGGRKGAKK
jgi:hypothetical protein